MLNNGRLPFMPDFPAVYGPRELEEAIGRRARGEMLPKPAYSPGRVGECILKACAPVPKYRFQTAAEFKMALQLVINELENTDLSKVVFKAAQQDYAGTPGKSDTGCNGSYKFNNSFGKSINHNENYIHANIFESSGGTVVQHGTGSGEKGKITEENEIADTKGRFCPKCGRKIPKNYSYCTECSEENKREKDALPDNDTEKIKYKHMKVAFICLMVLTVLAAIIFICVYASGNTEKTQSASVSTDSPSNGIREIYTANKTEKKQTEDENKPEPTGNIVPVYDINTIQITISSMLYEKGYDYNPRNVYDNDFSSAWVEGANGDGIGEWMMFTFPEERLYKGLKIINGLTRSDRIYYINNRVKRILISFSDGNAMERMLNDNVMGYQTIEFGKTVKTENVHRFV